MGEDGKNKLGQRKLVKGEKSFFLQPGERLEAGIQDVHILGEDEAIIVKAVLPFKDNVSIYCTCSSTVLSTLFLVFIVLGSFLRRYTLLYV